MVQQQVVRLGIGLGAVLSVPGIAQRTGLSGIRLATSVVPGNYQGGYVVAQVSFVGDNVGAQYLRGNPSGELLEFVRREISLRALPIMAAQTPRRTGRTAQGYRAVISKDTVQVINLNPFTPTIRARGGGRSISEIAQEVLSKQLPAIIKAAEESNEIPLV